MTKGLNQTFGHFTFSPILNNLTHHEQNILLQTLAT